MELKVKAYLNKLMLAINRCTKSNIIKLFWRRLVGNSRKEISIGNKLPYLRIFLIYFISYFFLILNFNGIYWDDYTLYNHSWKTLSNMFFQLSGYAGYFTAFTHYVLLKIGVYSYRILTFILMFLSGYFFSKILEKLPFLGKKDIYFLTIFFLIAPLFSARIALINFPYVLCNFLFYLAFFLLVKCEYELNLLRKLFISLIFFISFITNSILFFYSIVILYLFYKNYNNEIHLLDNIKKYIDSNSIFLILPIIFFTIKIIFFVPSGLNADYNKITLRGLLVARGKLQLFFNYNLIQILEETFIITINNYDLFIFITILFILTFRFFYFKEAGSDISDTKRNFLLLLLGIIVFSIGGYPYLVVNKMPHLNDWDSRHHLLLNFGFAFILYFGINLLFRGKLRTIAMVFVISIFIVFQIYQFYKYFVDYIYQQSIIENLKYSNIIRNNSTFVIENRLGSKMANGREFRFYELNGMSRMALNLDNRFYVLKESDIEKYTIYKNHREYNFYSWEYSKPVYIKIKNNFRGVSDRMLPEFLMLIIKFKYLKIFDNELFKIKVRDLVFIEQK